MQKLKLKSNDSGIDESVDGFSVKLKTDGGILKDANGLYLSYKIDEIDSQSLSKDNTDKVSVKLKQSGGISKDTNGLKLDYNIEGVQGVLTKTTNNQA